LEFFQKIRAMSRWLPSGNLSSGKLTVRPWKWHKMTNL
jgi:hypothetical protein